MPLFNRRASIIVAPEEGQDGIVLQDLRISFRVDKTRSVATNKASITVYNLSDATVNRIKEDYLLVLKAGYLDTDVDRDEVCFVGFIDKVTEKIQAPDKSLVIECGDGSKNLRESDTTVSYKSGASAKKALDQLIDTLKLGKKVITKLIKDKKFETGFSFAGKTETAISKVTKYLGLNWTVQNGAVIVTREQDTNNNTAVKLSTSSGLIGSPERLTNTLRTLTSEGTTKVLSGWRVNSLLRPKIEANDLIVISSNKIGEDKPFRVETVSHVGDTHGDAWGTTLQVSEL